MQTPVRLLLIVLVAPALAHVAGALVLLAPLLVFTAPVSYPLSVLGAGVAVPALHAVFLRRRLQIAQQLGLVLPVGAVLGLVFYLALFRSFDPLAPFAAWYAAYGVVTGLMCWILYNWGPLRVVRCSSPAKEASRDVAL